MVYRSLNNANTELLIDMLQAEMPTSNSKRRNLLSRATENAIDHSIVRDHSCHIHPLGAPCSGHPAVCYLRGNYTLRLDLYGLPYDPVSHYRKPLSPLGVLRRPKTQRSGKSP